MREKLRAARAPGVLISAATYIVALVVAVLVVRAAGLTHPLADLGLGTAVATVVLSLYAGPLFSWASQAVLKLF